MRAVREFEETNQTKKVSSLEEMKFRILIEEMAEAKDYEK
jgi:hypothetical protein